MLSGMNKNGTRWRLFCQSLSRFLCVCLASVSFRPPVSLGRSSITLSGSVSERSRYELNGGVRVREGCSGRRTGRRDTRPR